nr:MAG TPA: hypothetical protein [Caudoviricetes sp.]DAZ06263.1 MAG TPA: hypothetical protein [Caudoviricetes sp.]
MVLFYVMLTVDMGAKVLVQAQMHQAVPLVVLVAIMTLTQIRT